MTLWFPFPSQSSREKLCSRTIFHMMGFEFSTSFLTTIRYNFSNRCVYLNVFKVLSRSATSSYHDCWFFLFFSRKRERKGTGAFRSSLFQFIFYDGGVRCWWWIGEKWVCVETGLPSFECKQQGKGSLLYSYFIRPWWWWFLFRGLSTSQAR